MSELVAHTWHSIMRIALLMPMFVIISWFSLAFPEVYPYLDPWIHVIEGWSLCSFFLLLCEFIAPSQEERDVFLATKSIPRKKKNAVDGAKWFKVRHSPCTTSEGQHRIRQLTWATTGALDHGLSIPHHCFPRRYFQRHHEWRGRLLHVLQRHSLRQVLAKHHWLHLSWYRLDHHAQDLQGSKAGASRP